MFLSETTGPVIHKFDAFSLEVSQQNVLWFKVTMNYCVLFEENKGLKNLDGIVSDLFYFETNKTVFFEVFKKI